MNNGYYGNILEVLLFYMVWGFYDNYYFEVWLLVDVLVKKGKFERVVKIEFKLIVIFKEICKNIVLYRKLEFLYIF